MKEKAFDISRLYTGCNSQEVPKGVNLQLNQGECFDLVSLNCARKSTPIRSSLDFCRVDSGNTRNFDAEHRLLDLGGYRQDCAA